MSADRTRGIKARTTTVIAQATDPTIETATGMEIIKATSANIATTRAARANVKVKKNIISTRSKTTTPTRKASTARPKVSISMKPKQENNQELTKAQDNTHKQNQDHVPEIVIAVPDSLTTSRFKYLHALIVTGATQSIAYKSSLPTKLQKKIESDPEGQVSWTTKGGTYHTNHILSTWFQLTEFAPNCNFKHSFKIDEMPKPSKNAYDIILGCDLMRSMNLDVLFSTDIPMITMDGENSIECKPHGYWV